VVYVARFPMRSGAAMLQSYELLKAHSSIFTDMFDHLNE
jgi:hypothetical protein